MMRRLGAPLALVTALAAALAVVGAVPLPSHADEQLQFEVMLQTADSESVAFGLETALQEHNAERFSGDATSVGEVSVNGGYRGKLKRCMWCRGFVDSRADQDKRDLKNLRMSTEYKRAASEQAVKYQDKSKSHLVMSLDRAEKIYLAPPQVPEPAEENDVHDFHRRMRESVTGDSVGVMVMFNFRLCINEQSETLGEALAKASFGDDGYKYECTNGRR